MRTYPLGPRDRCLGALLVRRFLQDPLKFAIELGEQYGDLAYFRMGWIQAYFVNQPDLIRDVLSLKAQHFRKLPKQVEVFRQIDGNGLVNSDGEFWRRQRRLVQRAFQPKRMSQYADVMVRYTLQHIQQWSDGDTLDISQEMTQLTLAIIAKTLFNIELTEQARTMGNTVHTLSEIFMKEITSPFPLLPNWLPFPSLRRKRQAIQTLDQMIWSLIRNWRLQEEDHGDLLSILLLAVDEEGDGQKMTDQQVRDESMTLFIAGHDTSAAALSWICYIIATQEEIRKKLFVEIDSALGERVATLQDLPQLSYTEMLVKETLRLYPPAWGLMIREVVQEIELNGYWVPKGSWIYIFPYALHRHPKYFSDPEEIKPERFDPKQTALPPYAYIPFGGGPHVCIGQTFALTEMVLLIATILQHFSLTLAPTQPTVEAEPFLSLRPKNGLRLTLQKRASLVET